MKQTAVRFGFYSMITILVLSCIHFFILMDRLDYDQLEVIGYLTMVLSMIFVFFGIRYYRNEKNDGALTFGQGLKIGVLIVLFPSIFFGAFDVLYTEVLNPNWKNQYTTHYLEQFSKLPDAQYQAKKQQLEETMKLFSNPFMQFLLMFITVFVIGFIVSIISALALRRKTQAATNY